MKNSVWIIAGIGNGLFFITQGGVGDNAALFAAGVGLTSLGILAALDSVRARWQGSRLPALSAGIVRTHVTRVKSLYRLYQMAPMLVERQREFEQRVHQLEILEKQSFVWKRLATEVVFEQRNQNRIASGKTNATNAKIRFVAHSHAGAGDLAKILAGDANSELSAGEKALIVTDLGFSDVDLRVLDEAIAGKIELDYWIAKKAVNGSDLLALQGSLFQENAGRVAELLEKMSAKYDRVLVVAEFEQIALVEQSLLPDSERVLNAEIL